VSSWAVAVASEVSETDGFNIFLKIIPYNFYALLTIIMVFFICFTGKDFGPMKAAEERMLSEGPEKQSEADWTESKGQVIDLVLPIVVLIICAICGMAYVGGFFEGVSFSEAIGYNPTAGLSLGAFAGLVTAFVLYIPRGLMTPKEFIKCIVDGIGSIVPPMLILILSWSLGGVCRQLIGTGVFISGFVSTSNLPMALLPVLIFVIAALMSFSMGTSWGTFGMLIPIVTMICEADGAGALHRVHHLIEDGIDDENFFFRQAKEVVVVSAAQNHRASRAVEVGRFVDDDRRVPRPGDDGALRLRHRGFRDAGAPGNDEEVDFRVLENNVGGFERRVRDRGHQVVDSVFGVNRLIEAANALDRDLAPARVRVENDRVSGGDHIDRVVRDRRKRVRNRRNGADNAERRVFDDREAVVAAKDFRRKSFDALRVVTDVKEFVDFMFETTDFRLFHFHRAELDALFDANATDFVDHLFAFGARPFRQFFERLASRFDRFVRVVENAVTSRVAFRSRAADRARRRRRVA
jgi:hypothetical protein